MSYIVRVSNQLGASASHSQTSAAAIKLAMDAIDQGAVRVTIEGPDGRIYALSEFPELLARALSDADRT